MKSNKSDLSVKSIRNVIDPKSSVWNLEARKAWSAIRSGTSRDRAERWRSSVENFFTSTSFDGLRILHVHELMACICETELPNMRWILHVVGNAWSHDIMTMELVPSPGETGRRHEMYRWRIGSVGCA